MTHKHSQALPCSLWEHLAAALLPPAPAAAQHFCCIVGRRTPDCNAIDLCEACHQQLQPARYSWLPSVLLLGPACKLLLRVDAHSKH